MIIQNDGSTERAASNQSSLPDPVLSPLSRGEAIQLLRLSLEAAAERGIEVSYDGAKGSMKTQFAIIGDDYSEDGRVTSWRALLIENGKIVGLTQSFLWH